MPIAGFPLAEGVDFSSVERIFVRFNLDAGESIVLRGISTSDGVFRNGFED